MNGQEPETQPHESGKKSSSWIPWVIAAVAVAALVVTLVATLQPPREPGPTPQPTPTPLPTAIPTHIVTIMPDGDGCIVDQEVLKDVGRGEMVVFENKTGQDLTIVFDSSPFADTSIPVGSVAKGLVVRPDAEAKEYPYTVSCPLPEEARPRIVIRPET